MRYMSVHFVLLAILVTLRPQITSTAECDTEICKEITEELLSSVDQSVDPCDDFWGFTCGTWIENAIIPEDKPQITVFDTLADSLNERVKNLLSAPILSEIDPFYIKTAKNYYQKCVDVESIEKHGAEPILKVIRILGGWPLLQHDKWKSDDDDIEDEDDEDNDGLSDKQKINKIFDLIVNMFKLGHEYDSILSLEASPDMTDTTQIVLVLGQADAYEAEICKDEMKDKYISLIKDFAIMFGAQDDELLQTQIDEIVQFETDMHGLELTEQEKNDPASSYAILPFEDLSSEFPEIPWNKLFRGFFETDTSELGEHVIIMGRKFFDELPNLIKKTPYRALVNYMIWSMIKQIPYSLPEKFRDRYLEFESIKTGVSVHPPRWKECVDHTNGYFSEAISVAYINAYFGKQERADAELMVQYIRKEFDSIVNHLEWVDDETKITAIEKLSKMILAVGFPDEVLNKTIIENFYQGSDLDHDITSFLAADKKINKWMNLKSLTSVGKPNVRDDWRNFAKVSEINAYYRILENAIYLPAGFLQDRIYHIDRPAFTKFAALGYISGHELTHGFDDVGKQFDPEGNDRDWWTTTTDERFQKKTQCLIDQYNKFGVLDSKDNMIQIDGEKTVGENIADVGGLKIAFRAYQSYVKDNKIDTTQTLPTLDYNFKQLFFIKFGTVWCNKERDEFLERSVKHDEHSLNRMRVLGSVINLDEFGEVFNCPVGSNMNPKKKCEIW